MPGCSAIGRRFFVCVTNLVALGLAAGGKTRWNRGSLAATSRHAPADRAAAAKTRTAAKVMRRRELPWKTMSRAAAEASGGGGGAWAGARAGGGGGGPDPPLPAGEREDPRPARHACSSISPAT